MSGTQTDQGIPNLASPMVDGAGRITAPWRRLITALWQRTGASQGVSSDDVQAAVEQVQQVAQTAAQSAASATQAAAAAQAAAVNATSAANSASVAANAAAGFGLLYDEPARQIDNSVAMLAVLMGE